MKIKNIAIVICAIMAISLQAKRPLELDLSNVSKSPQEWLKKNATHEQKKLIVNLQYNNSLANLQGTTYTFVPHNSPELKMINSFPQFVGNYLIDRFDSLIFDQIRCQLKISTSDVKVSSMQHHKATAKEIENFLSDINVT